MKKKTVEAKFRAYLKPRWETEEMRKEMILAYNRKQTKKTSYKNLEQPEEKDSMESKKQFKEAIENEKYLNQDEKD